MIIERGPNDSAVVRISYKRGAKTIVETWAGTRSALFGTGRPLWDDGPFFAVSLLKPVNTWPEVLAVEVGASSRVGDFLVANVGNRPVTPTATLEGEGWHVKGTTCAELAPSRACTFSVEFRPTSAAFVMGKLTVTASPAPPVSVTYPGVGYYRDAGPDAAKDAAPREAGTRDAGLPDSDSPDADPADADLADAGTD